MPPIILDVSVQLSRIASARKFSHINGLISTPQPLRLFEIGSPIGRGIALPMICRGAKRPILIWPACNAHSRDHGCRIRQLTGSKLGKTMRLRVALPAVSKYRPQLKSGNKNLQYPGFRFVRYFWHVPFKRLKRLGSVTEPSIFPPRREPEGTAFPT